MPTPTDCKRILFNLGIKFGVSPRLISMHLLSAKDKRDMLAGVYDISSLEQSVELWRDSGMPDHNTIPPDSSKTGYHRHQIRLPARSASCHYREPFVCPAWRSDCHCREKKRH